ncbi:MAG TPA: glycosyltransferase family 1 protein [Vitreimonas sp.]|uniref:glycosyltransferase family 4 protein n=1 Tax=Vitreimonas sp. TaxID=3069702 RepID=UPI002D401037|nr:glycosyltransferase family 1 protein [Vitreimonas sp.]HYD87627.1 glycosyltransferase family 1 protein [Vitreimonas sp.]
MSTDAPTAPAASPQSGAESPALANKILLVTDAWEPQVNGVVRTLSNTMRELQAMGCEVEVISPADYPRTVPLITYSEIRLALGARDDVEDRFLAFAPDAVHIATEGTLGWDARAVCLKHKFPFTTSYHTQFPEYVTARFPWIPLWAGYRYMHAFHDKSGRVMVATPTMQKQLQLQGFRNTAIWSRGVDIEQFHPSKRGVDGGVFKDLPKPVFAYVGRVSVEKNIEAFLKLELPGSKVIVGGGPALDELKEKYPSAVFTGPKFGDELACYYADADVFVFPSFTDTFGLVILEAAACGTPVAGFVAPGPQDILPGTGAGVVDDDLRKACLEALKLKREDARALAERYSWRACAEEFRRNLDPLPKERGRRFWHKLRDLRKRARERRRLAREKRAAERARAGD